ncbi:cytochrome P450 [Boletus coccyginus]|nr:cytochrome P450 [Boletus coccyginus]
MSPTKANIRASDLVYSRLLGKDIIIINSEKIAKDLLGDRSRNYSDRPYFITHDMSGAWFFSCSRTKFIIQGVVWVSVPFLCHMAIVGDTTGGFSTKHFGSSRYPDFCTINTIPPNNSMIMYLISRKDDLVDIVANTLNIIVPAMCPDIAVIVDAFPLLLRLPSWLPEEAISSKGLLMEVLKEAAGSAFLGMLPMSPEIPCSHTYLTGQLHQIPAQTQIDAVVGNDRLPTTDDRPLLPFIDAILRETHRYSPVVPLSLVAKIPLTHAAVPHAAVDDDVYEGFHVPKGAILLANLWSMTHDESRFPNPHAFIPERFLSDDGSLKPNDIEHIALADTSVWTVIASVLAMFKISKPLDENEAEISVEPAFSSGLAMRVIHDRHFDPDLSLRRRPLPFKCRIVPRLPGMNAEKLEQLVAASTA